MVLRSLHEAPTLYRGENARWQFLPVWRDQMVSGGGEEVTVLGEEAEEDAQARCLAAPGRPAETSVVEALQIRYEMALVHGWHVVDSTFFPQKSEGILQVGNILDACSLPEPALPDVLGGKPLQPLVQRQGTWINWSLSRFGRPDLRS